MNCPKCGTKMEHGYLAAGSTSSGAMTRLEWFDRKPTIPLVGSVPLTGYVPIGNAEGHRCAGCRVVVASY